MKYFSLSRPLEEKIIATYVKKYLINKLKNN